MRSKLWVIGLVAVVATLAVGCGGGGGDTSGSTASESTGSAGETSKETVSGPSPETQLKYSANEACLNVPRSYVPEKEKLEKEYKEQGKPVPPLAVINEKTAIPPLRIAVKAFEGFPDVAGREQETEELAEALRKATEEMEKNPAAPFGGPGSPFIEFSRLSEEAGYEACARL